MTKPAVPKHSLTRSCSRLNSFLTTQRLKIVVLYLVGGYFELLATLDQDVERVVCHDSNQGQGHQAQQQA